MVGYFCCQCFRSSSEPPPRFRLPGSNRSRRRAARLPDYRMSRTCTQAPRTSLRTSCAMAAGRHPSSRTPRRASEFIMINNDMEIELALMDSKMPVNGWKLGSRPMSREPGHCTIVPVTLRGPAVHMARPERFELPTAWFVARYSIQLSYGRAKTGRGVSGVVDPVVKTRMRATSGGVGGGACGVGGNGAERIPDDVFEGSGAARGGLSGRPDRVPAGRPGRRARSSAPPRYAARLRTEVRSERGSGEERKEDERCRWPR